MRLSREYAFDMIEMVGKALSTARSKPADASWIDGMVPGWLRKKLPPPPPDPAEPPEDEYGLFTESGWKDSDAGGGAVHAGGDEDLGFSVVEKKKARRNKHKYGDMYSCRLWELQRKLSFKHSSPQGTLKDLLLLCREIAGFISCGWANRLVQIIDTCSRG